MKLRKIRGPILALALCLTLSAGAYASGEPAGASRSLPSARYMDGASEAGGPTADYATASGEPSEETTADLTLDPALLGALGVEIAVENGVITVSVGELLGILGEDVRFDEETSTLTVTDESGLLTSLLGLLAG